MSITLLKLAPGSIAVDERGTDFVGIHHFGFIVNDLEETRRLIEENGGAHVSDPDPHAGMTAETKCRDPNGIIFDIVRHDQAWKGSS